MRLKHRKHIGMGLPDNSHIVIYYSAGEVFLGVTLVILSVFFAHDYYISHQDGCSPDSLGVSMVSHLDSSFVG
jgi:hypothetical protein